MTSRSQPLSLVETGVIVLVAIGIAAGFLLPALARPRESRRQDMCSDNLKALSGALTQYRTAYNGYFPFVWQVPDGPAPSGTGSDNAACAAASLSLLYPRWLKSPEVLRCPSTEDKPALTRLDETNVWVLGTSGPAESSYGYDPRLSPRAAGKHAVMADMDGSYVYCRDTSTFNHEGGQNVLYVDGSVKWQSTNFAGNDPADNIFCEDAWNADTDSFLLRTDRGLGVSFEGYPRLHYR